MLYILIKLFETKYINNQGVKNCIYSNKVLYHLTRKELRKSLNRQWNLLNENGILFHSFST
mgnify:CR=1 FL=1